VPAPSPASLRRLKRHDRLGHAVSLPAFGDSRRRSHEPASKRPKHTRGAPSTDQLPTGGAS
jgi:hypothetical protein